MHIRKLPLILVFLLLQTHSFAQQSTQQEFQKIMSGISNHGVNLEKPYATNGDRIYIIGTQDGMFPDMGGHIKGEMGGIWLPPFKLADGFWVKLADNKSGKSKWLDKAREFINYPYGNKFIYEDFEDIRVERTQMSPDNKEGVIITFSLKNLSSEKRTIDFDFALKSDLRPVWFADTVDHDDVDVLVKSADKKSLVIKDSINPWWLAVKGSESVNAVTTGADVDIPENTSGNGIKGSLKYSMLINGGETLNISFVISGSDKNENTALQTCNDLLLYKEKLISEKKLRYPEILKRSIINIPDDSLQQVYNWLKINTDWLIRNVPGKGSGLSAGLMEYPWWFGCDNTYALQGVLATGNFKLAKQTLQTLLNKSEEVNGNGRIVHEISLSGRVYNPGNTQETAHFIMCMDTYLKWTGDVDFVKQSYPYIKKGINWLTNTMDKNHDLFPEGYGIMEVSGLNAELIDVAVYTQQALLAAADMAVLVKDNEAAEEYNKMAAILKEKINNSFWDPERTSYCDFYGSREQAITATDGALKQLKTNAGTERAESERVSVTYYETLKNKIAAMPDGDRGWLTNVNWVINTPMECGIAPAERAFKALDQIRNENCGPYGPYLSAAEKKYMMTIATGVQAVAECRYGRTDQALWYMHKITDVFNRVLPGSISEMMPDYGCFTQAWTDYGIDVPLVNYIFGIKPDAYQKKIEIAPAPPKQWKKMSIKNVQVGNNQIALNYSATTNNITYTIDQTQNNWKLYMRINAKKCRINGKPAYSANGIFTLTGNHNQITFESTDQSPI